MCTLSFCKINKNKRILHSWSWRRGAVACKEKRLENTGVDRSGVKFGHNAEPVTNKRPPVFEVHSFSQRIIIIIIIIFMKQASGSGENSERTIIVHSSAFRWPATLNHHHHQYCIVKNRNQKYLVESHCSTDHRLG
ncbi:hypothetical protein Tsp_02724 [Trichinella spiralis]|uniref:hypothetical protein n=1 Tax=Trichinella spiralis TaxID=6334 RepID=UPI0001EFC18B|nr:hypothetical protein Tsp_02724 [Trichinella spiralis]